MIFNCKTIIYYRLRRVESVKCWRFPNVYKCKSKICIKDLIIKERTSPVTWWIPSNGKAPAEVHTNWPSWSTNLMVANSNPYCIRAERNLPDRKMIASWRRSANWWLTFRHPPAPRCGICWSVNIWEFLLVIYLL